MNAASRGTALRALVCAILSTAVFLAAASAVPEATPAPAGAASGRPCGASRS